MVDYPEEILPSGFFVRKINFDSKLVKRLGEFFVCRRIERPIEDYLYDDGRRKKVLNVAECLGKNLIGLSMNLMGTPFKENHLPYRAVNEGNKDWDGRRVLLDDFSGHTDNKGYGYPLYYSSKSIHRQRIPYTHVIKNRDELNSISQNVKSVAGLVAKKYPINANVEYELFIKHCPKNLNYWHVQMEIKEASRSDDETFEKERGWLMKMYKHEIFGILEKEYVISPNIPTLPKCVACYFGDKCLYGGLSSLPRL